MRESEERLRRLADAGAEGVAVIEGETIIEANRQFAEMHGYRLDELIGRPGGMLLPPVELARVRAILAKGEEQTGEYRSLRKDGREIIVEARGQTTTWRGRRVRFIAVNDITARKKAEEALRRRAEEIERLLDIVPAAVWVAHDPQCLTITGNKRANEFYEAHEGENVSATSRPESRVFFAPDGHQLAPEELPMQVAAAANRDVRETELHVVTPSGNRKVLIGSATPLRDDGGNVRGCLAAFMDITARKGTEEALRASETKYRNLFMNMTEEVHFWKLVRDESGQIRTWTLVDANPPTLKTWGRNSVEEIRGKTTDEIFGPGAAEHYMPIVRKIMNERMPHSYEDYFPNLDKHFQFTTVPLGEYFITTGSDITAIKKAQERCVSSTPSWSSGSASGRSSFGSWRRS